MAVDIKEIVGKDAIKGLEKTNEELKQSNDLLKEQIKLLDTLNKEYGEVKTNVQLKEKLNKQEKVNVRIQKEQKTITQKNTALQNERIKVEQQKKRILAQTLALEEKGTKSLIKGQERLKIARKKAREEAQRELGVVKKQGGLFKSMTKSILAAGAAFISFNAVAKAAGKLLKTVFLGTQDNIDFFNQKLEGTKAQFAVLTDSISNFGDRLVKTFSKNNEDRVSAFTIAYAALAAKLGLSTTSIVKNSIEMEKRRKEAEQLQKMMDELNEKEVEYIGTRAALTKEMRLARLESKKAGDDNEKALFFVDKAIEAEKELMTNEMAFAKERSRIANERLNLSISTRQDRKEAAILAAKVTELEVTSIKRLTTLETERLTLVRKLKREYKGLYTERLEDLEKVEVKQVENFKTEQDIGEKSIDALRERNKKDLEDWNKREEERLKKTKLTEEEIREIAYASADALQEIGGVAFQFQQNRLNAELEATRVNYDARIQAAEGNSEIQEALSRELAQKQWEIQVELAKSAQNQALFDIAINTAVGVSKALAEEGPLGIVTGALITAAGLAQAALVTSQPLPTPPQFAEGGITPSTFIAGEAGRELMVTKDGQVMLTPNHATLYDGMKDTHVIPNQQTEQILSAVNLANAGAIDNKTLENKLDNLGEIFKKSQSKMIVNNYKASNKYMSEKVIKRFQ